MGKGHPADNLESQPRNTGFVRMVRSQRTLELMRDPLAFTLLAQIAYRARWKYTLNQFGLEIGEALIGDHETVGMTRRKYRTRVERLTKWGFLTTKTTNKGTIAKLVSHEVFAIDSLGSTHSKRPPKRQTSGQQAASKRPLTNKDKKDNKENSTDIGDSIAVSAEEIYLAYPRKVAKPAALKAIRRAMTRHSPELLLEKTKAYYALARSGDMRFVPYPQRWFNEERYNDDPETWNPGTANRTEFNRGAQAPTEKPKFRMV